MSAVVITYIFAEPQLALGRFVPYLVAVIVGSTLSLIILILFVIKLVLRKDTELEEITPIQEEQTQKQES